MTGSYPYNLDPSQRRAHAVVRYVLSPEFPIFRETLASDCADGQWPPWSQPLKVDGVMTGTGRCVEFQFRLRDDELIQQIRELPENR